MSDQEMRTQRERLAELLHKANCLCTDEWYTHNEYRLADALLARDVRVVDVDTLAAALYKPVRDYGVCRACGDYTDARTCAENAPDVLAALDAEGGR